MVTHALGNYCECRALWPTVPQKASENSVTIPAIGRNDPCPCGSGRKFKKCCLGTQEFVPSEHGAAAASADLRQVMDGMQFRSLREVQAFIGHHCRAQELRRCCQAAHWYT